MIQTSKSLRTHGEIRGNKLIDCHLERLMKNFHRRTGQREEGSQLPQTE